MIDFLLKKKKTRWILAVILLMIIVGFVVSRIIVSRAKGNSSPVETAKVERKDLSLMVLASGLVEAEEKAQVRFQTSGQLAWVGVAKGDQVKKWQALASLDKRELEKELEKELNDFKTEKWTFDQTHDDYQDEKDNAVITKEIERILDKAQFDLSNQVIEVELADLALKYATIYSPIEGIVTEIDSPLPGINITPAQATFVIVNPNSLAFYLKVNETEVAEIEEGQEVNIRLDAFEGQEFSGLVSKMGFTPLSGQGTYYQVVVSFSELHPKFRVGMSGDGEILVEEKEEVLAVPQTALIKRGQDYSVFKVVDGRAWRQAVAVGLVTDQDVEVLDGLSEGDIVVASGVSEISDGEKI